MNLRRRRDSLGAALPALLLTFLGNFAAATSLASAPPSGPLDHADLVKLLAEFKQFRAPSLENGVADFSTEAVKEKRAGVARFHARLQQMNVAGWPRPQQVDWLLVRSLVDQYEFELVVSRPWARDPGFYLDSVLQVAFTDLPVRGEALDSLRQKLRALPPTLAAARHNLDSVAADYAALALRNLERADGVGHEQPVRPVPPPGVIGWYDDLLSRARAQQPELVPDIDAAAKSLHEFRDWLKQQRPRMTGKAGVGRANLEWYLKHVKLLPWSTDQLLLLGQREFERMTGFLALERQRNRALPELQPATSKEEYERRIAEADRHIRRFIVEQDILTIPDYVGEFDHNVPWIVRPGGLNFWEQVQFRDPRPDHVHAVIPGHRFDQLLADHSTHPIRAGYSDGARVEGWAVYLEEAFLQLGLLKDLPRTRELFYIFGIKRAVRVNADLRMHLNEVNVPEAVSYMRARVPWLDEDVARVDAEIYLRQPPGYGFGYTVGKIQVEQLLADRSRQLGAAFSLRQFHDEFLAAGRMPVSLIRYEMTGLDEEIRHMWHREPLPVQTRE
jgi:hypothetical protein